MISLNLNHWKSKNRPSIHIFSSLGWLGIANITIFVNVINRISSLNYISISIFIIIIGCWAWLFLLTFVFLCLDYSFLCSYNCGFFFFTFYSTSIMNISHYLSLWFCEVNFYIVSFHEKNTLLFIFQFNNTMLNIRTDIIIECIFSINSFIQKIFTIIFMQNPQSHRLQIIMKKVLPLISRRPWYHEENRELNQ